MKCEDAQPIVVVDLARGVCRTHYGRQPFFVVDLARDPQFDAWGVWRHPLQDSLQQRNAMLEQLIYAANLHAKERHQFDQSLRVEDVDEILDRERGQGDIPALVPCYGAWFGQHVVDLLHGQWIGLNEPVAPRISVAGTPYSPFDAIARRLQHADAAGLQSLVRELEASCTRRKQSSADIQNTNLRRWNSLSVNSPFVNRDLLPHSKRDALLALDPWLQAEGIENRQLLCLAAGGGTHAPLHTLAGANVTVVDFCDSLLEIDREFAARHQLAIATHCCSMDDLPRDFEGRFDLVLQPVSLCYTPDPRKVYSEVKRALRPGGLYVVQHKSPDALRLTKPQASGYLLEFPQADEQALPSCQTEGTNRENGAVEFAHSLDSLIGELCRSGFRIEDFSQPIRADGWAAKGSLEHRALYAPPYIKIKARRI